MSCVSVMAKNADFFSKMFGRKLKEGLLQQDLPQLKI
jgi:hypothetical protein